MKMKVSAKGLDLIRQFEGLRLKAYQDSVGVWTIGYGHTRGVRPGETCTKAEADRMLELDAADAEAAVRALVEVPLTQGQFDALVSFVFNLGAGAFGKSTLLRFLNGLDYIGASEQFTRWVHAGGAVLLGLVRRRRAEKAMFCGEA